MPSDKFLNLSLDKKEKLIEAAKIEFATNKYEDASVNKIIKNINMPRGSFYLYFENKLDLYLYLLKNYIKDFKTRFIDILEHNNNDIFKSLIVFYDEIVKNNTHKCNLINNIFINMNSKQLDIAFPRIVKEEIDGSIISKINMNEYNISYEEKEILLSILMPLLLHAVAISLENNNEEKTAIRVHYLKQLNIIKRGLERKEIC